MIHLQAGANQAKPATATHDSDFRHGALEPYNPDFNPIEQVVAKLKGLLRTAAARTVPDLGHTIPQAFARVTADECRNGLAAAGYNTDLAVAT